jgi:hypothetical protein
MADMTLAGRAPWRNRIRTKITDGENNLACAGFTSCGVSQPYTLWFKSVVGIERAQPFVLNLICDGKA